jgi:hypothetical protein
MIPRTRFAMLTCRPKDAIRAASILRAAYEPWWRKRQVFPATTSHLTQFAARRCGAPRPRTPCRSRSSASRASHSGAPMLSPDTILARASSNCATGPPAPSPSAP